MSNKKNMPATVKSAAGKTNLKQKKADEKNAQKLIEEKKKKQAQQQKRSEEIHKQRQKESEKEKKALEKAQNKQEKKDKRDVRKNALKNFVKAVKYYTSLEFIAQLNLKRIFFVIVVPIVLIVFGIISLLRSVPLNVPSEIRNFEFNGRVESEIVAKESVFNLQQQDVIEDSLNAKGNRKIDCYFNSVVPVDDNMTTENLEFGNRTKDSVLIATIYDGDKILYRSLGLEEGKEINSATFFESLSYGIHNVRVAVNAYEKVTGKKIGTKYADIKLAVGVEYNGE